MALRFRKSFKLGPGVRLNLGKKGFSVSAGVRGARITSGTSGTRITAGIPGTGISYTSKLNRTNYSGMTNRQLNAELRRLEKEEKIQEQLAELHDKQADYEKFTKIANFSPRLLTLKDWEKELEPKPFEMHSYGLREESLEGHFKRHFASLKSTTFQYRLAFLSYGSLAFAIYMFINLEGSNKSSFKFGLVLAAVTFIISSYKMVKWYLLQKDYAKQLAIIDYEKYLGQLCIAQNEHPKNEKVRIEGVKNLMAGDLEKIENQLEDELTSFAEEAMCLNHSFETEISFDIFSSKVISLDVDLPEIENVTVTESKKVLKSGKVSEKEKNKKDINAEYASGVTGIAFNLASHVFNISPSISTVMISGYTQRINKSTGIVEDDYIYSVSFERSQFSMLNLREIDSIKAIGEFEISMELNKANEFKAIKPLFKSSIKKAS